MCQLSSLLVIFSLLVVVCVSSRGSRQSAAARKNGTIQCYKCVGTKTECIRDHTTCEGIACKRFKLIGEDSYKLGCLAEIDEGIKMTTVKTETEEILYCDQNLCNSAHSSANSAFRVPSLGAIALSLLITIYRLA
ncbi:hypothetical protein L596_014676 [Steinernema carpocapsae]|uniref:UPAR/Ly6 domain-containing protein n=1 Tax=Steinernema carpocapsae TaxID=34508 RepID=A0A4U5NDE3_STECR|nr:hypothetical protein L596_014676 [Steinernema carpocapsae]